MENQKEKNNETKQKQNNPWYKKWWVIIIIIVIAFYLYQWNREKRYKGCTKACFMSNTCIEYSNYHNCTKWSQGSCENICIEKYK